jgi:hypothetical protein
MTILKYRLHIQFTFCTFFLAKTILFKFNIGFKMLMIRRNFPRCRSFCCILTNTSVRKNIFQILRFAFLQIFSFTRNPLLKLPRQIETQNFCVFSVQNLFYLSRYFIKKLLMNLFTLVLPCAKWTIVLVSTLRKLMVITSKFYFYMFNFKLGVFKSRVTD